MANRLMKEIKKKLEYIYDQATHINFIFHNNSMNDHSKRCFLRRFFILVDAYLYFISRYKNHLKQNLELSREIVKELETFINNIRLIFVDDNYSLIRDKISAHNQELSFSCLIEWWNQIDYSSVTTLYEEMTEISKLLKPYKYLGDKQLNSYEEIDFSHNQFLSANQKDKYCVSSDRLGLSKKNTVGIIPLSDLQDKCGLILSIIDFIFINGAITIFTQNYKTKHNYVLFDTAWLLLICDTCDLITNLFEGSLYSKPLVEIWPSELKDGKLILAEYYNQRDLEFESKLKNIRNEFAAHIDDKKPLKELISDFHSLDLNKLHKYYTMLMQGFQSACFSNIYTRIYSQRNTPILGDIKGITNSGYKSIND